MAAQELDEEAIFQVARKMDSPQARAEYLAQVCGADQALRQRLEALLQVHDHEQSFLRPPSPSPAVTQPEPAITEGPGTVIGPYKLLEEIGEGGFGVVFLAEQTQPVRRKVALKILKPGMDTRQVVARFEAERQALAIMDHPNIAKVFDGGATRVGWVESSEPTSGRPLSRPVGSEDSTHPTLEIGRPYFVMELVKGVPITEFCDQNQLTPRQRLELFIAVCQAVQHAHQKGIIHRDLKPSNILVVMHDTTPVPKVIDFGIAKALGQELTDKTLFTGFAQMVGTPLYMSPEQAGQSGLDIDTRSDIYSLGVLLYELLTGTTPFTKERFKEAAYDEIRRIIREEEPPKPSTRLSESKDSLPSISANRHTEPAKLTKLVRGELDWIVMKCLEKDRNRRYETANGLAMDLQRYLADEPVQACPPSAWYRFRKLARRNKAAFLLTTGAALMVVLALLGLAIGTLLISRERNEKAAALVKSQERTELARDAVDKMYIEIVEQWAPRDPQRREIQQKFLHEALRFYLEFAKQQSTDPEARLAAGKAVRRVGDIQDRLGKHGEAGEAFQRSIGILDELVAEIGPRDEYLRSLGHSYNNFGVMLQTIGRFDEAERAFRTALQFREKLLSVSPDDPDYREDLASCHNNLGTLLPLLGRSNAAEEADVKAVSLREKLAAEFPKSSRIRSNLAGSLNNLAGLLSKRGDHVQAKHMVENAIAHQQAALELSQDNPTFRQFLGKHHLKLGEVLERQGATTEAERAFSSATAITRELVSDFPNVPEYRAELASGRFFLGRVCMNSGQQEKAVEAFTEAITIQKKLVAESPLSAESRQSLAISQHNLGTVLSRTGRHKEAEQSCRDAQALTEALIGERPDSPDYRHQLATIVNSLGLVFAETGRYDEAEKTLSQAMAVQTKLVAEFPVQADYSSLLAKVHRNLGALFLQLGRTQDARKAFSQAREVQEKQAKAFPNLPAYQRDLGMTLSDLGSLLRYQGDWISARPVLDEAILRLEMALGTNPRDPVARPLLRRSHCDLGFVCAQTDKYREAVAEAERCLGFSSEELGKVALYLYNSACIYALASGAAAKDASEPGRKVLADRYADRAVQLLRQAFDKGYDDLDELRKDTDLDPIRQHAGFQKLLKEKSDLRKGEKGKPPPNMSSGG